ncbi:hypothetical protein, partial [Roseospira goensis]|uniref:hypothetical protein n=1 Tax=Roseospira goensis TaxID=391922 RepID=UPI001C84F901
MPEDAPLKCGFDGKIFFIDCLPEKCTKKLRYLKYAPYFHITIKSRCLSKLSVVTLWRTPGLFPMTTTLRDGRHDPGTGLGALCFSAQTGPENPDPSPDFFGSSRNSGEGGADLEKEVGVIPETVGHPLD